jgi:hypothetical protein
MQAVFAGIDSLGTPISLPITQHHYILTVNTNIVIYEDDSLYIGGAMKDQSELSMLLPSDSDKKDKDDNGKHIWTYLCII